MTSTQSRFTNHLALVCMFHILQEVGCKVKSVCLRPTYLHFQIECVKTSTIMKVLHTWMAVAKVFRRTNPCGQCFKL